MSVTASIKFVQGISAPPAGRALVGVLTTPVVCSNGDNSNVEIFEWAVVDAPLGSAVPLGVVASGSVPTFQFVPDLRGGYLIRLTVFDIAGNRSVDFRVFQVPEPTGYLIPPFDAEAPALNFSGQTRGWAKSQEELLRFLSPPLDTEVTFESTAKWKDTSLSSPVADKVWTRARRRQIQTTTATANQVIDDGGLFGSEDFTLPDDGITVLTAVAMVKKNNAAEGGTIEYKGAYYRNNGGAPVLIGTVTTTVNVTGFTPTGDLNVNGNKVEIRVSPGSAITLDWRLIRVHYEGVE